MLFQYGTNEVLEENRKKVGRTDVRNVWTSKSGNFYTYKQLTFTTFSLSTVITPTIFRSNSLSQTSVYTSIGSFRAKRDNIFSLRLRRTLISCKKGNPETVKTAMWSDQNRKSSLEILFSLYPLVTMSLSFNPPMVFYLN